MNNLKRLFIRALTSNGQHRESHLGRLPSRMHEVSFRKGLSTFKNAEKNDEEHTKDHKNLDTPCDDWTSH